MRQFLLRFIFLFIIVLTSYYFLFLVPKIKLPKILSEAEDILGNHHYNLLQNRLALVELTKFDPNTDNLNLKTSSLVETIQKTNEEGLRELEKDNQLSKIDPELDKRFPQLLIETKEVYQKQNIILEKIFNTDSFEAGIEIIRSKESVENLTKQTNLILEYEFWLKKISETRAQFAQKESLLRMLQKKLLHLVVSHQVQPQVPLKSLALKLSRVHL
jgi:hypothetical protein